MLRICAAFVLTLLPFAAMAGPNGLIRVIDADTWDVGRDRVRLHGIDAPELAQTCDTVQGKSWACGRWASDQVRAMYDGKIATCEMIAIDRYKRTVAKCHVAGQDVGREIVSNGLAFAYRQYSMEYDLDEKGAAITNRGLHGHRIQSPAQFRKTRSNGGIPPDHDCVIKGNISSKGTKIFHLPGQQHYNRTGISLRRGERWFCTAEQAKQAGWRAAKQ